NRKDEGPGTAEAGDGIGEAFAEAGFLFDQTVGNAIGAAAHELLRGMELAAEPREHVHAGVGLHWEQHHDDVAIHFETLCLFESDGVSLVRSLFKHGSKAEKFATRGLIHNDFLMVFVHGGYTHFSRNHHVRVALRVADLVNTFAWGKSSQLDL